MATEKGIEHDGYRQQLFRGGAPSTALYDFIFPTFSIIDITSQRTITKNIYVRSVSLLNPGYITNFTTKNGVKNLPPELYSKNNDAQNQKNDSVEKNR